MRKILVKIVKDDEREGKYLVEVEKDGKEYQITHVVGYDDLLDLSLTAKEVRELYHGLRDAIVEADWWG